MSKWFLDNFPSGKWTWGWFMFQAVFAGFVVIICAILNLHEGKRWNGKPRTNA